MSAPQPGIFNSIDSFLMSWEEERKKNITLFEAVPDRLWHEELIPGYRSLARLAWHIILTPGEALLRTGIKIEGPSEHDPLPSDPQQIIREQEVVAKSVAEQIRKNWNDETLKQADDMYGESWTRSATLTMLIHHTIHHRGQMTALLRLGNAKVPGLYGPSMEEWAQYGMTAPEV